MSAHKGLKYYDVHYLRHHTIWIPKVETKTIQMRPNLAGYTSRRGYSIFRGFFGARPLLYYGSLANDGAPLSRVPLGVSRAFLVISVRSPVDIPQVVGFASV